MNAVFSPYDARQKEKELTKPAMKVFVFSFMVIKYLLRKHLVNLKTPESSPMTTPNLGISA